MTKTLLSLATTPAAWLFLIVALVFGIISAYYIRMFVNNAKKKYRDYRGNTRTINVTWLRLIRVALHAIVSLAIAWQSFALAKGVALQGKLSWPRLVATIVLLVVSLVYNAIGAWVTRNFETEDEEKEHFGILRKCRWLGVIVAVVVLAMPIATFAGSFHLGGKPRVATDKDKTSQIALNIPGKEASNGQDDDFVPSDRDTDALVEKWYGQYPDPTGGALKDQPFPENDTTRDAQSEYKHPVLFPYTDSSNKELTGKETIEAILYAPTYGGGKAEFYCEFDRIAQQNPELVELAKWYREKYDSADGEDPDGLQYILLTNPKTGEDKQADQYRKLAALTCEIFSKFNYGGVEARQTREQWGLPTEFETQEDIPTAAAWKYHVSDPIPYELRYMKKYTQPEEQDSLPAVIWTYKCTDGTVIEYGTGVDNKNMRLFSGEVKQTSTKKTVTETYTPPTTTSNPPTVTPPGDPDPEDPDEPDPVTPDPTPSQEPAKDKNDDPVNQGNAPVGGGENKPDNTTGNDKTQPKPNRNEGGGGSNVTVPSGGNNGNGQSTAQPDGSGNDGVKTSGNSSGISSGHTQDTSQTSPTGGNTVGGTAPDTSTPISGTGSDFTYTQTTENGNGDSTQTVGNANNETSSGAVDPSSF